MREAVEEGIGDVLAAKKRLDEVYAAYAEPDADFDKLAAEQAELEAHHRRRRQREHRPAARNRRRRAAPAAVGRGRSASSRAARSAASRCAACCCPSPTCCCSTSRPTTSTPKSVDWLEQFLPRFPGTVVAITHDRYFLDNAAEWILELDRGRGIP